MKFIREMKPGDRISDIYFCKARTSATTKNGKPYDNLTLQDKTGNVDAKVWDPNSAGIDDFEAGEFVEIMGEATSFNGMLQINVKRARKCREGEYDPAMYMPVSSRNNDEMFAELMKLISSVKNKYLRAVLDEFFVNDTELVAGFRKSSAAKSIHHGFIGGLLEHTLSVANLCDYYCKNYSTLNRDLLITAAICHDIGKVKEISPFPENDYTDDGNFLGHIVIGAEMVHEVTRKIPGFPPLLDRELRHCILSHHGQLEYGSPKKPVLMEAVALNMADDTDAKLETFREIRENATEPGWLGYNRLFESNLFDTRVEY
ncbi:3'-5' exoribonuclease YhaM family protein [Butyrivibrio sp. MC2013]|uniref:3'-5' exoribonuclease YhaM family protein n=1 Tax=Butyrivibrio sp. MC2013 TaxID=1280686 RepID=UPI000412CDD1|nr:HD domain-containing protein [Butyrivibrio sp. MC2013]